MVDGIRVDPAALEQPAQRFSAGADSCERIKQAILQTAHAIGEGAQDATVAGGADVFGQGVGGVLTAYSQEARMLSTRISQAGAGYRVTDETAINVQVIDQ